HRIHGGIPYRRGMSVADVVLFDPWADVAQLVEQSIRNPSCVSEPAGKSRISQRVSSRQIGSTSLDSGMIGAGSGTFFGTFLNRPSPGAGMLSSKTITLRFSVNWLVLVIALATALTLSYIYVSPAHRHYLTFIASIIGGSAALLVAVNALDARVAQN